MLVLVFPKPFERDLFLSELEVLDEGWSNKLRFGETSNTSSNSNTNSITDSDPNSNTNSDSNTNTNTNTSSNSNTKTEPTLNCYALVSQTHHTKIKNLLVVRVAKIDHPGTHYKNLTDIDIRTFLVMCINESDIGFNNGFSEFVVQLKEQYEGTVEELTFVLCGTCGGSQSQGHNIGETFFVDRAVKYDRGFVTDVTADEAQSSATLPVSAAKKIKVMVEFSGKSTLSCNSFSNIEQFSSRLSSKVPAVTMTGNQLLLVDPTILAKELLNIDESEPHHAVLGEMETYDFYEICKRFKLRYYCFRTVSDVPGLEKGLSDKAKEQMKRRGIKYSEDPDVPKPILLLQRICRKTLNMEKLVGSVFEFAKIIDDRFPVFPKEGRHVPPELKSHIQQAVHFALDNDLGLLDSYEQSRSNVVADVDTKFRHNDLMKHLPETIIKQIEKNEASVEIEFSVVNE